MANLAEVRKKLGFADYLLNSLYAKAYPSGALKHVLEAANILVVELTGLDKNRLGPQVIKNKLEKIDEKEAEEFSKFYLDLWQMQASKTVTKQKAKDALTKVNSFVNWVEKSRSVKEE